VTVTRLSALTASTFNQLDEPET